MGLEPRSAQETSSAIEFKAASFCGTAFPSGISFSTSPECVVDIHCSNSH